MTRAMEIPTLNIAEFSGDDQFVADHGNAYKEFGFCGVTGHGIGEEVIGDAYRVAREFFALPEAVKERYHAGMGGARGYTRFGVETAKDNEHPDLKEFWHVGREMPEDQPHHPSLFPNLWPAEVDGFQYRVYRLYEAMDDLANRVLDALALYLEQAPGFFRDKVDTGNSLLRLLHYPPIAERDTRSLRAAAHEDINLITLLVGSEEPGLEILTRSGDWIPVRAMPDTIVVNIGDMMQRLTNHVLPSTTHRVVNVSKAYAGESRYSIPFFCQSNPDFEIATLTSCIFPNSPNRYPQPISTDDYLTERLVEIGLLEK